MAREGAKIAFVYLEEDRDAEDTLTILKVEEGAQAIAIRGDIGDEGFCRDAVQRTVQELGRLDILVNHAGEQHVEQDFRQLAAAQLERTFRTNVFGYFFMTKAALDYLGQGSSIINTTSVTAYKGYKTMVDYAATRGAIVSFTRSMALALVDNGIRVNGVAPGPIWTPLIPASFDAEKVAKHGGSAPMDRVGQPNEVAPCYVFLASEDASYMTGQILHPNGGTIVGS
jgi:NAD(P)-dependent dehydrogenase (short-subunit alcohol dehydrogenase family)